MVFSRSSSVVEATGFLELARSASKAANGTNMSGWHQVDLHVRRDSILEAEVTPRSEETRDGAFVGVLKPVRGTHNVD